MLLWGMWSARCLKCACVYLKNAGVNGGVVKFCLEIPSARVTHRETHSCATSSSASSSSSSTLTVRRYLTTFARLSLENGVCVCVCDDAATHTRVIHCVCVGICVRLVCANCVENYLGDGGVVAASSSVSERLRES